MMITKVLVKGKVGWKVTSTGRVFFGKQARQRALDNAAYIQKLKDIV